MGKLFGTDGARGVANKELTCDIAYHLGQAAVRFLGTTVVVGKDTRLSGDMLEAAFDAGVMSAGGTVLRLGVIPTPAVALLVRELRANGGIVISASHNPPEYNGIKFFDEKGFKLPEEREAEIEEFVLAGGLGAEEVPDGDAVGTTIDVDDAVDIYIDHVVESVRDQGIDFSTWRIALDCAHGASSVSSAQALRKLGAEVHVINDEFGGTDINVNCGSTHLDPVRELVAQTRAHIGIAHDGDADRVLFVDEEGSEIDGDMVEAACALDLRDRGMLKGDTVVSTVMCNLGFVRAMEAVGIKVEQTPVGDRHVLNRMREGDFSIGGEQSGHTIFLDCNSTGDGLMTACQFLAAITRNGGDVKKTAAVMQRFPQELVNVRVTDKEAVGGNAAIKQAIASAEAEMGDEGRVLVRASGTEPLIRVMVEAATLEDAARHAHAIADVVTAELGA